MIKKLIPLALAMVSLAVPAFAQANPILSHTGEETFGEPYLEGEQLSMEQAMWDPIYIQSSGSSAILCEKADFEIEIEANTEEVAQGSGQGTTANCHLGSFPMLVSFDISNFELGPEGTGSMSLKIEYIYGGKGGAQCYLSGTVPLSYEAVYPQYFADSVFALGSLSGSTGCSAAASFRTGLFLKDTAIGLE